MRLTNFYMKLFFVVLITVVVSGGLILGITISGNVTNNQQITEKNLTSSVNQKVKLFDTDINHLNALVKSIGDDVEIVDYFNELNSGRNNRKFIEELGFNLEEEVKSYPGLLENAFFSYNGKIIVDGLEGKTVGYDLEKSNSEWYTTVKTNKSSYMGKPVQSPATKRMATVSAYPILDENSQLLAIFGVAINLNTFSDTVIENSEESGENTMIIDEDGIVVAAKNTELVYSYNIEKNLPKLYSFIENQTEGITYYQKDGVDYIASVKQTELGMTVVQSLPVSMYQEPIIRSIIISVIILFFIFGCVAYVSYIIAKNMTKPINILVEEFDDMALGTYDKDIPEELKNRNDEFKKLANSLETMKKQTMSLINDLTASNEEIEATIEDISLVENELRKQNELLVKSEHNLKNSNNYISAIIDVLPDIIFLLDREGTFTDCQSSQESQLLMPEELFLGKKLGEVMPSHIAEIGYSKIKEALDTGNLQCFEYELDFGNQTEIFELRIVKCFSDSVVAIARNITNQRNYQLQIEYLSYHDQLTGLYNRRFFEEELKRLDTVNNLPLGLIMVDVNGLKLINDSFGHKAGDLLLTKVAEVLTKSCENTEIVSRIGGDEFVIIIPKMRQEQAEELCKRITMNCQEEIVATIHLSISYGWEVKWNMEEDIHEVLKCAEDYMYKKKLFDSPSMRGKTIGAIINTLHEKNKREEQHSQRVSDLCVKLAIASNMSEREINQIKSAGLFHDIGKIAIQENLLNKPGRLTKEEFEEVARHPEIGYRILGSVNDMADIAEFALFHHERWDGNGYPKGLKGEEIPIQARMISIVDSYDAMTGERSYKMPLSEEEAVREIVNNAGTQFDTDLAYRFVSKVLGYNIETQKQQD